MLRLIRGQTLSFSFPEVHEDARLKIELIRTFRVPDDDRTNRLPPGFEPFPMEHVEDYRRKLPPEWLKHKGLLLPMYQAEALWIDFESPESYPFAVRIGAGKICAVTGEKWKQELVKSCVVDGQGERSRQNYLAVPEQPWLDGFNSGDGVVRQFVAMPLGSGATVEEQLTGAAEFGGIQIEVYPLKAEKWEEDCGLDLVRPLYCGCPLDAGGMGLAAGGRIHQEIFEDDYEPADYDFEHSSRVFIHILNSLQWNAVTGLPMPRKPVSAADYAKLGLPWFDYYADAKDIAPSDKLANVKSVGELDEAIAEQDGKVPEPTVVINCSKTSKPVEDGSW